MALDNLVAGIISSLVAAQSGNIEVHPTPISSSFSDNKSSISGRFLINDNSDSSIDIVYSNGSIYARCDNLNSYIRDGVVDISSLSGFGLIEFVGSPQYSDNHIYFVTKIHSLVRHFDNNPVILDVDSVAGSISILRIDDDGDGRVKVSNSLVYVPATNTFEDYNTIPAISAIGVDEQSRVNRIFTEYPVVLESRIVNDIIGHDVDRFMKDTAASWDIFSEYELGLLKAVHEVVINKATDRPILLQEVLISEELAVEESRWYYNPFIWVGVSSAVAGGIVTAIILSGDEIRRDKEGYIPNVITPSVGVQDGRGF